jgi:hypothetical protein
LSEPVIGRWAPGVREKKLGLLLLILGFLALFTSIAIALMAVDANKFFELPTFLILIPFWAAIAIVLGILLQLQRVGPLLFMIGSLWLVIGFLPAIWAEFLV